ncbi:MULTISPECIES: alpha/beta fold hydrolase [unclassified Modestobacter]|uniref:alpha/beta fold hydrolase n=1 Tax=unclassified Modestobacter TaxID=2643866 RepID=UPI0022AB41F6|nr:MULTISPECIES: alpha/beta hydrolase [unclassified Modestobacter]MCZ2822836.1 alpha/beta hydrolase [Modestobacter sp. VKM Ac-2981]MCZ2851082.1 alpha/beta hydrolase [Modestobacter sp. VKM Ac-2982]
MSARVHGVAAAALATAGLVAGITARRADARRLARRTTGSSPSVRTDDGLRLHVEVAGEIAAPTVVLVHGIGADGTMFDPQWTALRGRARLVRYDQRGHGASGWAGGQAATVARLGRDLGQVVDQLGGDGPVVVAGHSMGGMAVLALADQRPELFGSRITGAALLSTRAAPLTGAERSSTPVTARARTGLSTGGAWLVWLTAPLAGALHPFRSRPGQRLLRRQLFAGDPPEAAAQATYRMWAQTPAGVLAAYLRSLATYDQRAAIAVLRAVPVLVLAGTEDRTIPTRSAPRMAAQIGAGAELVLVDGAGHMVNTTHPDTVNAALAALLDRVQAPTRT